MLRMYSVAPLSIVLRLTASADLVRLPYTSGWGGSLRGCAALDADNNDDNVAVLFAVNYPTSSYLVCNVRTTFATYICYVCYICYVRVCVCCVLTCSIILYIYTNEAQPVKTNPRCRRCQHCSAWLTIKRQIKRTTVFFHVVCLCRARRDCADICDIANIAQLRTLLVVTTI